MGLALAPATMAWSQAPVAPAAPTPTVPVAPAAAAVPVSKSPLAEAINTQGMATVGDKAALRRQLIRAQVLLDRRHFSPGVVDGTTGSNLRLALRAFQEAEGLPVNGKLDAVTWQRLVAGDPAPVIRSYTLVVEDVAGPFAAPVEPGDYAAMAKRPNMTWMSVSESIAERAHMDEKLLIAMNPGAKFDAVGTELLVANTVRGELPAVASISVDKKSGALRAMDAGGKLVAAYPATVGSSDMPAPSGTWAVRTVAPSPNYTFDPSRLTFKAKGGKSEKLTIQPGPNNPVGSTWIDLTRDTYGIHGTPHPETIGKAESHGCVRLTNWDAKDLAGAVKQGTKVVFRGRSA
ncbi:murein L,D-transpeptidase [Polymorphobacter glacialis]|uniref:Murein L,D-transpeptidase n=2 Tax=Sandarakinorhabdus glacialis TaxID=1614636 RepID=A0A916ZRL3_9SPHN|nr:murein L,D-transpeptidase [Polymorphobacter glacialis]